MKRVRAGRSHAIRRATAAFVACAALALTLVGCGADTKGQTEETFGEAFYGSSVVRNGTFQSDYVNEDSYSVTEYACSNIRGGENGAVNADIEATIENENFTTNLKAIGTYSEEGGYRFDVMESGTTPKKGIDFDLKNGLEECQSELSQGPNGPICTAWKNPPEGAWFLERMAQGEYAFTSGVGWECKSFDGNLAFNKDIEGEYVRVPQPTESDGFVFDDGDFFLTRYVISNFDFEALTFDVEYTLVGNFGDKATITGKGTATLEPKKLFNGTMTYEFSGEGTSDAGTGKAIIKGDLKEMEDGAKTIRAYVNASGNGPDGTSKNWPSVADEIMAKQ